MSIEEQKYEIELTVGNQRGLHARVATKIVQTMRNYSSRVTVAKDGVEVDARSVLGLLLLGAQPGSEISLNGRGPDCREAIEEIRRFVQDEEPE